MQVSGPNLSEPKNRFRWWLLVAWIAAALGGMAALSNYSSTKGAVGKAINQWPQNTSLSADKSRPTLVMFLHPKCPCSKASMEEISNLLALYPNAFSLQIVFFQPEGKDDDWAQTALWKKAQKLPGAHVVIDQAAHEAKLFGALTSGDTYIFEPDGRLRFHGGVTPSRGSIGDNLGITAITQLAQGKAPAAENTAVFGCPIVKETR